MILIADTRQWLSPAWCHPLLSLYRLIIEQINRMRQRLDLDTLLRKYQTNYSPRDNLNEPGYISPRNIQVKSKHPRMKTQSNYYPENDIKYFNPPSAQPQFAKETYTRDKVMSVNFQMSKSECESMLLGIKDELGAEQRSIEGFINECVMQLSDKFHRQHEQLKRELLALIEQSLEKNRKAALDLIDAYRKQIPREYTTIIKKISMAHEEINSLLNGLNSNTFRKTIAEVVTKDFTDTIKGLREDIGIANNQYRDGLTGVELDRSKLVRIQQCMQSLYTWRNKEEGLRVSDEREEFMRTSRRSNKRKIFQSQGDRFRLTERDGSQKSAPKNMRRTFFNFDSNN